MRLYELMDKLQGIDPNAVVRVRSLSTFALSKVVGVQTEQGAESDPASVLWLEVRNE